ncbi:MAG: ATP-binding protein [Syntrophomonadaceae bacterium]|nr:ATP-binding protein [Syntrophomonadaceae bacterium]
MRDVTDILNNLRKNLTGRESDALQQEFKEPSCKLCHDRGIILIDGERARVCNCVKQKHLEQLYHYANITPEIKNCTFEAFQLEYYQGEHRERAARVLAGARQFAYNYLTNSNIPGILLTGDVGSGKTFLAGAIANFLLKQGIQTLFLVVPDFLDELRATYHKGGEETDINEISLLNGARQVEVLILDDLGAHNYTPWTCNKLYSLLNYRMNYHLPVIITTNLDLLEIEKFLGKRTTSRILQMCNVYRLTVHKDIRYQKSLGNKNY